METLYDNFERMKHGIFYELISTESSILKQTKEILYWKPQQDNHPCFQNLVLRYRMMEPSDMDNKRKSIILSKRQLYQWGISEPELHELAMRNTPILFPVMIRDLEKIAFRYFVQTMKSTEKEELCNKIGGIPIYLPGKIGNMHRYLITNPSGSFGAGAMLYPKFLHESVERLHLLQHTVYLLPYGKNEVLLFACKLIAEKDEQMIECLQKISKAWYLQLSRIDRLTVGVYRYEYGEDRLMEIL